MNNLQAFKQQCALIRRILQDQEDLRVDLVESMKAMQEASGCTNMEARSAKRWLKADVKGKLDDLAADADAHEMIGDILGYGDKKVVGKNVVAIKQHAPETGEITESQAKPEASAARQDPEGPRAAGHSGSRASGGAGTPAHIPGGHQHGEGKTTPLTGSEESQPVAMAPLTSGAGAGDRLPASRPPHVLSGAVPPADECPDIPAFLDRRAQ